MAAGPDTGQGGRVRTGRGESPLEGADRNMVELLQEMRVAQTGVQILFAFLLSLSFTERFGDIDEVQRWIYVVTLLLTAVTTGLLVAPAAVHRMLFGQGVKPQTVRLGHRLSLVGLVSLVLTLTGAVLLVLDVAVGRTFAFWTSGVLAVLLAALWFVVPLPVRRGVDEERCAETPEHASEADESDSGPARGVQQPAPGRSGGRAADHAGRALT